MKRLISVILFAQVLVCVCGPARATVISVDPGVVGDQATSPLIDLHIAATDPQPLDFVFSDMKYVATTAFTTALLAPQSFVVPDSESLFFRVFAYLTANDLSRIAGTEMFANIGIGSGESVSAGELIHELTNSFNFAQRAHGIHVALSGTGFDSYGVGLRINMTGTVVPEPHIFALLGLGLAGFLFDKRKKLN